MQLKIGLPVYSKGYKIEDGKITGFDGELFTKIFFSLKDPYYVDFEDLKGDIVGALESKVDFIYEMPALPSLPINITTGPAYNQMRCHLMTMKPLESHLQAQKFQNSLGCFDISSWIFILIATMLLIYIFGLSRKSSLLSASWRFFGAFFQGHVGPFSRKNSFIMILATILIWIFLIKALYLGSIHTDMLILEEDNYVEKFEDVIQRNLSLMESQVGFCFLALDTAAQFSSTANRSARLIKRLERTSQRYNDWYLKDTNITYLLHLTFARGFQRLFCYLPSHLEARQKRRPHISKKPVIHQILTLFHSVNLLPEKKRKVRAYTYANIEYGFSVQRDKLLDSFTRALNKRDPDQDCTNPELSSVVLAPLDLTFLGDAFQFFYIICSISIIIFFLEILSQYYDNVRRFITG